jgi:hypothetical protein
MNRGLAAILLVSTLAMAQPPSQLQYNRVVEERFDFRYRGRGVGGSGTYPGFLVDRGKEVAPIQCAIVSALASVKTGFKNFNPKPGTLLEPHKGYQTSQRADTDDLIGSYNTHAAKALRVPRTASGPAYAVAYDFSYDVLVS